MTEKRLFVGKKKFEDRFTIISIDDEIAIKENKSGDVLVLKHNDLNAQQFVAQIITFLNDQNEAIEQLFESNEYWSDKASERMTKLEKENEQLEEDKEELNNKKWEVMSIIIEYDTTNKYKNADEAIDAIKKELGLVMINE